MSDSEKIRELNDDFRKRFVGDQVIITSGIARLPNVVALLSQVRTYDSFRPEDDPYGEHDFGSLVFADERIFWKIDYYNLDLTAGAEDPSDPGITKRVLTVMLAQEY